MKNLFLLTILFCSTFVYAQTEKLTSSQIIVRCYESGGINPSGIIISYGNGETEDVDIKGFGTKKNWLHNLDIMNTVLDRIRKNGYSLINSNAGGNPSYFVSTYIFLRNDLVNATAAQEE